MWLLKNYLNGSVESVIKELVALPTKISRTQKVCLTYSVIANYLLKLYLTGDIIATVDAEIRTFKQQGLTAADYAQHP